MNNSCDRTNQSAPMPATGTPVSHQAPVSDLAHRATPPPPTTTHATHASPSFQQQLPSSSTCPPASQLCNPPPNSAPASSPAQPSHPPKPTVFSVPRNTRQILDFSHNSRTPESKAKRALLSDNPNQNAIALVGMGGAGKTTILRALGRLPDVYAKFPHGIQFFQLGHDAKVQKLLDQLEVIVTEAFPHFLPKFSQLAAKENTHLIMMEELVNLLAAKRFLLIFDDVWDLDPCVYNLVDCACKAVQGIEGACCKVLTSTRNEEIGRVPTHDVSISVSPEDLRRDTCVEILCCYAGINHDTLSSFSAPNREALDKIIDVCAGLPLALSVAGSAMQDLFGACTKMGRQDAVLQYWESLKKNTGQLGGSEVGNRHGGLNAAFQSSLESLEKKWEGKRMTVREMFHSLSIMEKQMCLPLCTIEKLWGVGDVLAEVRMLSRHSLVSLDQEEGGLVLGIRLHDLIHDMCVEMAEGSEGVGKWHNRLVDAYRVSMRGRAGDEEGREVEESSGAEENEWWKLVVTDKYMMDNIVRHLLGAGRVMEVLQLLTNYRWIERKNENKEETPFQKIIAELVLLRKYLEKNGQTETGRKIVRDIAVVERAMELSMIPFCMKNRSECTFQLHGRLQDVISESGVVERIVCSIERFGQRPWARAGRGLLVSGRSTLRRVLQLEDCGDCSCVGAGGDIVQGAGEGKVLVVNGRDGSLKTSLVGHEEDYEIKAVFVDRMSGLIFSCSEAGEVIIWKEYEQWRAMQGELEDEEKTGCMQVLPSLEKVVLGTDRGRILVMDISSGSTLTIVDAHDDEVTSLAAGGNDTVMVSGSKDSTVRVWDTANFEGQANLLEGHSDAVTSVALSVDGKLLASGSKDESLQLWNVQGGAQLWALSGEHKKFGGCVLFSNDGQLLFCQHPSGKICVWQVNNGEGEATLVHILPQASMYNCDDMCFGDGSELFGFADEQIHVWDVREFGDIKEEDEFLPGVRLFAVSADGETMVTCKTRLKYMEIRNVRDVSQRIDRVISSFNYTDEFCLDILAVSNDQHTVAVSEIRASRLHIFDARNGNLLHSLSDSGRWKLSAIPIGIDISSIYVGVCPYVHSLQFSSDDDIVSALAVVTATEDFQVLAFEWKPLSWKASSGELLDEPHEDDNNAASHSYAIPRLDCDRHFSFLGFRTAQNVKCVQDGSPFTIATLEGQINGVHYVPDMSRLLVLDTRRGFVHVDLITESTNLPTRDEPPLPPVHLPRPSPLQDTTIETESDEVYDVFISHAGTDKFSIAEPLYELLVALGFKVFLDRAELRPGQNAWQKMIKAMRTAKIAVVILSPEFAARKWTLKELMCFLERFRKGGEREMIIIPVFYRLTLEDCRNANSLFSVVDEDGENVFFKEGFLKWMAMQQELTIGDVLKGLQSLRSVTGIENKQGVTNGDSAEEKEKQKEFAQTIATAVEEANTRLESGRAAGPSS